jgi:hypothetical protein
MHFFEGRKQKTEFNITPVRDIHEANADIMHRMFTESITPIVMYDYDFTITEYDNALIGIAPIASHLTDPRTLIYPENISALQNMSKVLGGRVAIVTNRVDTRLAQFTFNSSVLLHHLSSQLNQEGINIPIFQGLSKQLISERKLEALVSWINSKPFDVTHLISVSDYNFPFITDKRMLRKLVQLTGRPLTCHQYLIKP